MRKLFLAMIPLLAASLPAAAQAHAFLNGAMPPVGGTVAAPPREIRLFFSEAIEPRFSTVAVETAAGRPIETGRPEVDPADRSQLFLPVPPLAPGQYKVVWHVVSVDTHRTEGNFTFTIGP
ncbi:MAG: copper resistance protein CopC [Alphaproteobacteria bacterium]|nr:copper resistance protein CopC [Alphaproteobacteria bacterium]MBV9862989.1 copper resistance protein CopC [Alphaproteobacteria bacterium]